LIFVVAVRFGHPNQTKRNYFVRPPGKIMDTFPLYRIYASPKSFNSLFSSVTPALHSANEDGNHFPNIPA
jgi:hypothetical protein